MSGKQAQLSKKEGAFIVSTQREAYESLAGDKHFLLVLGWTIQRCGLSLASYTTNGSELFQLEGRRQVAIETINEIEKYVPDIQERVAKARQEFRQDLRKLTLTPDEEAQAEEENDDG